MADTKEETSKELEEKKEVAKPFYATMPTWMLILGGVLVFFALQKLTTAKEGSSNTLYIAIIVIVVLYFLSKRDKEVEKLVSPKEAELLAERECERKIRWNQWPLMTKYAIGPVSDLIHKDGRGLHYKVGVAVSNPYWAQDKFYIAKVMASGLERGFTTLILGIGEMTGRDIQDIKDITKPPAWLRRADRYSMLEKLWTGNK